MTLMQIIGAIMIMNIVSFTLGLLIGQEETKKEMIKQRRQRLN